MLPATPHHILTSRPRRMAQRGGLLNSSPGSATIVLFSKTAGASCASVSECDPGSGGAGALVKARAQGRRPPCMLAVGSQGQNRQHTDRESTRSCGLGSTPETSKHRCTEYVMALAGGIIDH